MYVDYVKNKACKMILDKLRQRQINYAKIVY